MQTETEPILIISTTNTLVNAKDISRSLIKKRLAACVNIIPKIYSIYRWKDKITEDEEYILFIKSYKIHLKKIFKLIPELHSYELPEILSIKIDDGSPDYFKWMWKSMSK